MIMEKDLVSKLNNTKFFEYGPQNPFFCELRFWMSGILNPTVQWAYEKLTSLEFKWLKVV